MKPVSTRTKFSKSKSSSSLIVHGKQRSSWSCDNDWEQEKKEDVKKKERLVPDVSKVKQEFKFYLDQWSQGNIVSEGQKVIITKSWNMILESCEITFAANSTTVGEEDDIDKMTYNAKVFEGASKLGAHFFTLQLAEENPSELFQIPLQNKDKILFKVFTFLINTLHDYEFFRSKIKTLGLQHHIFGVNKEEYLFFSKNLSKSIINCIKDLQEELKISLDSKFLEQVENYWLKYISDIGELMFISQKYAEINSKMFIARRKIDLGLWKISQIILQAEYLYICKKLYYFNHGCIRLGIPIHLISDLKYIDEKAVQFNLDQHDVYPYGVCFSYEVGDGSDGRVEICFEQMDTAIKFYNYLDLQMSAYWLSSIRTRNVQVVQNLVHIQKNKIARFNKTH